MAIIRDAGELEYFIRVKGLPDDELKIVRFDGVEAISELFEFDMELVSENPEVSFDKVVGQPVSLTMRGKVVDGAEQDPRYVHGLVAGLEQGSIGERLTTYFMRIVPRFWVLTNRVDTRVFQEMTVPDIVKDVFENASVPANAIRDALKETYSPPPRILCSISGERLGFRRSIARRGGNLVFLRAYRGRSCPGARGRWFRLCGDRKRPDDPLPRPERARDRRGQHH